MFSLWLSAFIQTKLFNGDIACDFTACSSTLSIDKITIHDNTVEIPILNGKQ
jgi:hypothetical protein